MYEHRNSSRRSSVIFRAVIILKNATVFTLAADCPKSFADVLMIEVRNFSQGIISALRPQYREKTTNRTNLHKSSAKGRDP